MLHALHHFLSDYGYWALALTIGLESMGLSLPGETILVMASLHAGHRGESIAPVSRPRFRRNRRRLGLMYLSRHEAALEEEAEKVLP